MTQLFANFEVNRTPRWPILTRLVMASIVAHGLFFVAVAYGPGVQGLFRVAGTLAGFEFVSEDYDHTLVGQRATVINLTPHEKLYYPADYFTMNQPFGEPAPGDAALVAQVAPPPPPPPVYKPRRSPGPRVVSTAPMPEATPTPEIAEATPTPSPQADEEKKAEEAELDRLAANNGVKRPPRINTKPFEDIAQKGKELVDKGSLDLKSSTVDVSATAERNEDGTLKPETVKIEGTANNETMSALAIEFVNALSESKVLAVLEGAGMVRMSLKLDGEKVSVNIKSDVASDADAAKMATGYGVLLLVARSKKEGTDEGELWKSVKVSSEGKQFVMTFEMPRAAAAKMIADKLAKKAAAAAATPSKG